MTELECGNLSSCSDSEGEGGNSGSDAGEDTTVLMDGTDEGGTHQEDGLADIRGSLGSLLGSSTDSPTLTTPENNHHPDLQRAHTLNSESSASNTACLLPSRQNSALQARLFSECIGAAESITPSPALQSNRTCIMVEDPSVVEEGDAENDVDEETMLGKEVVHCINCCHVLAISKLVSSLDH